MNDVKVEEYLEHVKARKSISVYRLYRKGLELFFDWLKQDPTVVLEDAQKRSKMESFKDRNLYGFKVEEFYKALKEQGYAHNSARVYSGAVTMFFHFYNVNLEVSTEIHKVVGGQKCYVPTVTEFRKMFQVADLRSKVVLSLGLDLGWRIGDFQTIKKQEINLNATEPQPIDRITQKENVEAHSFISTETLELLKLYIPTLPKENPYLFPNGNGWFLREDVINAILHDLTAKTQIQTGNKTFTFHGFRKRLLSQAIDVHVDPNAAKLITGKAVAPELQTYIESADFKAEFQKLRDSMKLSETTAPSNHAKMEQLEEQNLKLREQVEDQGMRIEALLKRLEELDPNVRAKYHKTLELLRERKRHLKPEETT